LKECTSHLCKTACSNCTVITNKTAAYCGPSPYDPVICVDNTYKTGYVYDCLLSGSSYTCTQCTSTDCSTKNSRSFDPARNVSCITARP
jgi:hypothetical protein